MNRSFDQQPGTALSSAAPPLPTTLRWVGSGDGRFYLLDQTRLPGDVVELHCATLAQVVDAIKTLKVRGAPAIGIAAAYGLIVGLREACGDSTAAESPGTASTIPSNVPTAPSPPDPSTLGKDAYAGAGRSHTIDVAELRRKLDAVVAELAASRPTAVNLFAALDRMTACTARLLSAGKLSGTERLSSAERWQLYDGLLAEATAIHDEDRAMCRAIGRHGSELLKDGGGVLTHCNAGGLATSDYGTALAVIFAAVESGKRVNVFVDETRPLLQGARLTAWELVQRGIPATLICDSMAAQVMREGRVSAVVVGADRIAANGDTANKIGTYGVAVLAKAHGIPFYVAAPATTFDLSLADGAGIPIEQRASGEITHWAGRSLAPLGVDVYNPAFDVTPANLITALITDRGVIQPVDRRTIEATVR